jgi:hypothetical protein
MSTIELRKRLLEKIQKTANIELLEEVCRLLDLEGEDAEIYKLNDDQGTAIAESRQQIKKGQFLTGEQADKEIDEWLNK